jgi:hypothetical protein
MLYMYQNTHCHIDSVLKLKKKKSYGLYCLRKCSESNLFDGVGSADAVTRWHPLVLEPVMLLRGGTRWY